MIKALIFFFCVMVSYFIVTGKYHSVKTEKVTKK